MNDEKEGLQRVVVLTQQEKGALQVRVKELETDLSKLQSQLLDKKNEIENVKLQQVARSVSPQRPSSVTRFNDSSLVPDGK